MSDDASDKRGYFLYTRQERADIPRYVTHVRAHPSVRVIKAHSFSGCSGLLSVILNNGLKVIGVGAFEQCRSLKRIVIPPAIKVIRKGAFRDCSRLMIVILGNGLEETILTRMDDMVYFLYTGQERIPRDVTHMRVHPSVGAIKAWALNSYLGLKIAILCDELEEIGEGAFYYCTSLVYIMIPLAVKVIGKEAFYRCSRLRTVTLNDGLE